MNLRHRKAKLSKKQRERNRMLVDALRSGEFKQTKHYLQTADGHCCLGVACEVYHRVTGRGEWIKDAGVFFFKALKKLKGDKGHPDTPPNKVAEWFGWYSQNPSLVMTGASDWKGFDDESATHLNDEMNQDFNQIADAFERTFLEENN